MLGLEFEGSPGSGQFYLPHLGSVLSTSWAVEDSSATQPGRQPMAGGQTSEGELRYPDPDSVSICNTISLTKSIFPFPFC